jgi:hypothetical protein
MTEQPIEEAEPANKAKLRDEVWTFLKLWFAWTLTGVVPPLVPIVSTLLIGAANDMEPHPAAGWLWGGLAAVALIPLLKTYGELRGDPEAFGRIERMNIDFWRDVTRGSLGCLGTLAVLAVVVFVALGVIGLLVFGIRQIF